MGFYSRQFSSDSCCLAVNKKKKKSFGLDMLYLRCQDNIIKMENGGTKEITETFKKCYLIYITFCARGVGGN